MQLTLVPYTIKQYTLDYIYLLIEIKPEPSTIRCVHNMYIVRVPLPLRA